jgi:hypothetical protein
MHKRTISTTTSFSSCCYGARCHSASDRHVLVLVESSEESERSGSRSTCTEVPTARGERTQGLGKLAALTVWIIGLLSRSVFYIVGHRIRIVRSKMSSNFPFWVSCVDLTHWNIFFYIIFQGHHISFVYGRYLSNKFRWHLTGANTTRSWSQWPRCLRRGFASVGLLGLWVQNPPEGMDVCVLWVLCVVR